MLKYFNNVRAPQDLNSQTTGVKLYPINQSNIALRWVQASKNVAHLQRRGNDIIGIEAV